MKKMKLLMAAGTVLAVCLMLVPAASAASVTYGFHKITNNGNADVGGQLFVEVTDSPGPVSFKFTNNVGIASSITDIYFDDGTLLAIANISSSAGVAFDDPANPSDLPGGNLASPPFVTTQGFSADSDPPVETNGVNAASEWVTITFTLQGGQTYADTIAALGDGSLRIGLHVQSIGTTRGSDSYVNNPFAVPLPSSAFAGLGLMLAIAGIRVLRHRRD